MQLETIRERMRFTPDNVAMILSPEDAEEAAVFRMERQTLKVILALAVIYGAGVLVL